MLAHELARRLMVGVSTCAMLFFAARASGQVVQIDQAGFQNVQNLQHLALAMHNYTDVNGALPGQYIQSGGTPLLSWRVSILPYLGYASLYNSFDLTKPWDDPANLTLLGQMPDVYRSPADAPGASVTHYVVGAGSNLIFDGPIGSKLSSITDGTSNTLMIGEATSGISWTKPDDIAVGASPELAALGFSSITPNYTPFVFADGVVHFLSNDVPSQTLLGLFTKNGGEVIDPSAVHDFVVVPEPVGLALCAVFGLMRRRRSGGRAEAQ